MGWVASTLCSASAQLPTLRKLLMAALTKHHIALGTTLNRPDLSAALLEGTKIGHPEPGTTSLPIVQRSS